MAGQPDLTDVEISALGKKIYREQIRPLLTEADIGKYVIVDVHSGEYEIADRDLTATRRLKKRMPTARTHAVRVGFSAAYFLGWHEEPQL